MLQIKNIKKEYRTGTLVQRALDDVSLNLRDNEFVAILGPSGSGKTTLLNIIGGLDRYDSGDLVINGVSTRKYRDRDWDSYRNHVIGFVFQSYNLISHQTVLANVELALTISGISGSERRRRAEEALDRVGLKEQMNKRPSQMSGGQMQRVAIARALVNDPDILLADEPTGALDTETSIQIMDLLKEVARDRLVIMVTHNPELAEQYATRIVRVKDGHMVADSDPLLDEGGNEDLVHRNLGRASMSFLTALKLSMNNLRTKKARTILVSFAGSIGIIGIALIFALSNGVNQYIQKVEEDTLSEYPLQITSTGFDLTSLMSAGSDEEAEQEEVKRADKVGVFSSVTSFFSKTSTNDLGALRQYLDDPATGIMDYANAVEYHYDLTPQIYRIDQETDKVYQVNPDTTLSSMGMGNSIFSGMMGSSGRPGMFYELPSTAALYEGEYDVMAGRWPTSAKEAILVVSSSGRISDMLLYTLGLRAPKELDEMVNAFENSEKVVAPDTDEQYDYEEFLGISYKVVTSADFYTYDGEHHVWTNHGENEDYVADLARAGRDLTIVGVARPRQGGAAATLSMGINYPHTLTVELMADARESGIVKDQLADRGRNVLTGNSFDDDAGKQLDLSKMFTLDQTELAKAFSMDTGGLNPASKGSSSVGAALPDLGSLNLSSAFTGMAFKNRDLASFVDPKELQGAMPGLTGDQIASMAGSIQVTATQEDLKQLWEELLKGYVSYAGDDPSADITGLAVSLQDYLGSEEAKALLSGNVKDLMEANSGKIMSRDQMTQMVSSIMAGFPSYVIEKYPEALRGIGAGLGAVSGSDATIGTVSGGDGASGSVSGSDAAPGAGIGSNITPGDFGSMLAEYLQDPRGGAPALASAVAGLRTGLSSLVVSEDQMQILARGLAEGYETYAVAKGKPSMARISETFRQYLASPQAQALILKRAGAMVNTNQLQQKLAETMTSSMSNVATRLSGQIERAMNAVMEQVAGQLETGMNAAMANIAGNMKDMFQINPRAFANAIQMNMSQEDLQDMMTSLMSGARTSYENNLRSFGYAAQDKPSEVVIYPKDFEAKQSITGLLEDYNRQMTDSGQEDKVITYTDLVATMMSSVTRIINTISYVLIAFVAVSLIVSSIMIGVITYISVLERRKEIGILRAIGASKKNVASVFNAETFITGLLAGLMGIGITVGILIPANAIIHSVTGNPDINAILSPKVALGLILLSILLTLMGGLIPSGTASRSDPVEALRSE